MRRRIMRLDEQSTCTQRDCLIPAAWWLTIRVDDLDVDHARCEEHSRC
jgi:hypothetical protein